MVDAEHFLLLCPSFDFQRRDLAGIVELLRPFVQITNLPNYALMQLLLSGDQYLSYDLNRKLEQKFTRIDLALHARNWSV